MTSLKASVWRRLPGMICGIVGHYGDLTSEADVQVWADIYIKELEEHIRSYRCQSADPEAQDACDDLIECTLKFLKGEDEPRSPK